MGLDMYLYLRKYESCGKWDKDYNKKRVNFYPKELGVFEIDRVNFMTKETNHQVGYWRKANAIHKWFVDECQPIYVSFKKIKELRNLVGRVLECHEKAEELLPTCGGFFFGGQEYDEWYFKVLEYTKELLDKIIVTVEKYEYDIIYQASW